MIGATQYFLPLWMQVLIGLSAALVAGGIVWKKLIQPVARLITLLDTVLPMLNELAEQFKDTPHAFKVLNDIIREFRTDSGSTLRDVVNRLEKAANENKVSAQVLATNVETARKLAEQDREQLEQVVQALKKMSVEQRGNIKTTDRIELRGKIVASELDAAQSRAEKIEGQPGEAADAAVRRTKK